MEEQGISKQQEDENSKRRSFNISEKLLVNAETNLKKVPENPINKIRENLTKILNFHRKLGVDDLVLMRFLFPTFPLITHLFHPRPFLEFSFKMGMRIASSAFFLPLLPSFLQVLSYSLNLSNPSLIAVILLSIETSLKFGSFSKKV